MKKLLIVLLADRTGHENMARALHALLYAKQAAVAGVKTELIFDGGGTAWAAEFYRNEHFKTLYETLLKNGVVKGVCAFCSKAFGVDEELEALGGSFIGEDNGHPDIGKRVADGWEVITL